MSEQQENTEVVEDVAPATTVPVTEIEAAAAAQGWQSDGELGALEFLANGRVFRDRLADDVKALKAENEKIYGLVAEQVTKQDSREHATVVKSIKEQIQEAVEAGDTDKVLELTQQIPPPPVQVSRVDPGTATAAVDAFKADNQWFRENVAMRDDALGFYEVEKQKLGIDDPTRILPEVLKRVKKVHKDFFEVKNPNEDRGADVEKGAATRKSRKKGLQRSDLTETESAHIDDLIDSGLSEAKLLKSIEKQREQRSE